MISVVVGASSGLGRALAEELARKGSDLLLVARDDRDLRALASDLALRYSICADFVAGDAGSPETAAEIEYALAQHPPVDGLFFPIGCILADDHGGLSQADMLSLLRGNLLSVIQICDRLTPRMKNSGSGVVACFSSVAAARGRRRNIVYAAAKRALESYCESLRHELAPHQVRVQLYIVGYLDTGLAPHPTPLPKGDPAELAKIVVKRRGRETWRYHYPRYWGLVVAMLRWMPWVLFRRLDF